MNLRKNKLLKNVGHKRDLVPIYIDDFWWMLKSQNIQQHTLI